MISDIRKVLGGSFVKYFVWIAIGAFAIGYIPGVFKESGEGKKNNWVMKVNSDVIDQTEFLRMIHEKQDQLARIRAQYGEYADMLLMASGMSTDPKQMAFDDLVRTSLITQAAHKEGLLVSEDMVAQAMRSPAFLYRDLGSLVPYHLLSAGADKKALGEYLRRNGMTIQDFESFIDNAVRRDFLTSLLRVSHVSPAFMQDMTVEGDRVFSVLTLPVAPFVEDAKKVTPTDADLQVFFEKENIASGRYVKDESRRGTVWQMPLSAFAVNVTNEDVEKQYAKDSNLVKYLEMPARIQVRRILFKKPADAAQLASIKELANTTRERIVNAPDKEAEFIAAAKEVSQDTETSSKGGLLALFPKGMKERVFEHTAFALANPSDVSAVIETKEGIEILQLVKKEAKKVKPLASVADDIRKTLVAQEQQKAFTAATRALVSGSTDSQATEQKVAAFASEKNAKKSVVTVMRNAEKQDDAAKKLFQVSRIGDYGFVVADGKAYVVRLDDVVKIHIPQMSDVRNDVLHDYYVSKAMEQAGKALEAVQVAAVKANGSLADLKKDVLPRGARVTVTAAFDPTAVKDDQIEKNHGVSGFLARTLVKKGAMLQDVTPNQAVLVRLDTVQQKGTKTDKNALWSVEEADLAIEGFVASLYRNAKIETNEAVFSRC